MKKSSGLLARVAVTILVVFATTSLALAQNSNVSNINLNAALAESLSISLSGAAVNFTLTGGSASNPGDTTIDATTTWVLKPGRTAVKLYAYFDSAPAALVHTDVANSDDIPSSAVEVGVNGGAVSPVSSTVVFGAANAGLQLFNQSITGVNKSSNRTDTLNFNINLSSLPQLSADTYSGTLHIQAQATP